MATSDEIVTKEWHASLLMLGYLIGVLRKHATDTGAIIEFDPSKLKLDRGQHVSTVLTCEPIGQPTMEFTVSVSALDRSIDPF